MFSLFGKPKIKPATALNSNVWYHVTEGRVDKPGRKFSSMLQVDDSGLKVFPVTNPPFYWQFQPIRKNDDDDDDEESAQHYVVRNSRDGAAKQLSACRNATEPAPGQTGLCMAAADGADAAQVWRVDQWGADMLRDGLRFVNAANGSRFWLDVHEGNPPFMNSNVTGDAEDEDAKGEPSQKWYVTSAQAVNAIEYSTIATIVPTSTAAETTATAATTADPAATTSAAAADSASSGLSTGAQAGIGIGAGLAGLAVVSVAALLLFRRRRRRKHLDMSTAPPPSTNKPLPPLDEKKPFGQRPPPPCELPGADADGGYHNVGFHEPQELPTPTTAREAPPVQRYELDSTPVHR